MQLETVNKRSTDHTMVKRRKKQKGKKWFTNTTQKNKNQVTRITLKSWSELSCFGIVSSSLSTVFSRLFKCVD